MAHAANDALVDYLLRLGDDSLVLGHRLSEWCGHGPALETDLALTNVALDLVGRARLFLTYAGDLEGAGRDEDALAYGRDVRQWRNLLLTEQDNGDFGVTIVRQFLFDAFDLELLRALSRSADPRLAGIAEKSVKETEYHLRFSADWVVRLGDGTEESHRRVQRALDDLWSFTGELFTASETERAVAAAGIAPDPVTLRDAWLATVDTVLADATLTRPADGWMQSGGKTGMHGEGLGYLLAEFQSVQRAYPGLTW
jgi:ring-1,2-phenylacetyl-CoA epoxidase subunit PaaC